MDGDILFRMAHDGLLAFDVPPKKGMFEVLGTDCLLRLLRFEGRFGEISMCARVFIVFFYCFPPVYGSNSALLKKLVVVSFWL